MASWYPKWQDDQTMDIAFNLEGAKKCKSANRHIRHMMIRSGCKQPEKSQKYLYGRAQASMQSHQWTSSFSHSSSSLLMTTIIICTLLQSFIEHLSCLFLCCDSLLVNPIRITLLSYLDYLHVVQICLRYFTNSSQLYSSEWNPIGYGSCDQYACQSNPRFHKRICTTCKCMGII